MKVVFRTCIQIDILAQSCALGLVWTNQILINFSLVNTTLIYHLLYFANHHKAKCIDPRNDRDDIHRSYQLLALEIEPIVSKICVRSSDP